MRPEDLDKLFRDRLGPSSPTPPADLWSRLQDRIETEMPSPTEQEQNRKGFMYLSYSIAAAIALLLTVGIVFYNVQRGTVPVDGMAHNNGKVAEQPIEITKVSPEQGMAQVTEPAGNEAGNGQAIPEINTPATAGPAEVAVLPKATIARSRPKQVTETGSRKTVTIDPAPAREQVAQVEKPAMPDAPAKGDYYNIGDAIPARFASNSIDMNAQPVEIIIKRAVAVQQIEEDEELSGFEKKQKLAKNIFKQVRNLSNGERVELSELGINTEKIAVETQIGKQKISKVINL